MSRPGRGRGVVHWRSFPCVRRGELWPFTFRVQDGRQACFFTCSVCLPSSNFVFLELEENVRFKYTTHSHTVIERCFSCFKISEAEVFAFLPPNLSFKVVLDLQKGYEDSAMLLYNP